MSRLSRIALPLAVIVLVIAVQWRALFSFFSADDLVHLQQACGLLPTPHVPWRFLTQVVYFRLMLSLVGPWPGAFMVVNLALHATNVALLIGFLAERRVPRPTVAFAAVLFGACPLLTVVIAHAVIINDISALTFSLLALRWLSHDTAVARVKGTLAFLVALFCKESVLFLPLVAGVPVAAGTPMRARLQAVAPVLAIIICASVAFLIARSYAAAPSGGAYVLSVWPAPFHNLMTYTSWVVSLHQPLPDLVRSLSPTAWRIGLPVLLLIGGVATWVPAVRSTILFGLAWWVLGLLPVLPLPNSAYPHYMYVALPGIALALAAAMQGIFSPGHRNHESRIWPGRLTIETVDSGLSSRPCSRSLMRPSQRPWRWSDIRCGSRVRIYPSTRRSGR